MSSLFPYDLYSQPIAIQTDIVGTAGSSGSPIVEGRDGRVFAIAQSVKPAQSYTSDPKLSGVAKIGLAFGVSTHLLTELAPWIHDYYRTGLPTLIEIASCPLMLAPLGMACQVGVRKKKEETKES